MTLGPVYLDTNIFIAAYETDDVAGRLARLLLAAAENGAVAIVTSELALSELLVGPLRAHDGERADLYRAIIRQRPGFRVVPVDRRVLEMAALRRAEHVGLRLPDAIHRATADLSACTVVATADDRLPIGSGQTRLPLSSEKMTTFLAAAVLPRQGESP